jgi:hypothetical protein
MADMLNSNSVLKDLDLSDNYGASNEGAAGAVALAKGVAEGLRDNGAISSVNLLENSICVEQARALTSLLKEHPTLKSLCGNKGDETELDMSNKMRGTGDAIMLAAEVADNGALSFLDVSNNNLGQLVPPEGWRAKNGDGRAPWIHTDGRELKRGTPEGSKPEGVIAIANAIPDMGALRSLNLSSNNLKVEGTKIVAGASKVTVPMRSFWYCFHAYLAIYTG